MKNRLSVFAAKKYSVVLFTVFAFFCMFVSALIGGYNVLSIMGDINESCTVVYLLDYKVGFTTRLLIGQILALLTDNITPTLIYKIGGISVLVSFIVQSILGGAVLRKSIEKKEYVISAFTLVFLLNSLTSLENIRIKGCLDTYILILFLLWLFLYDKYAYVISAPFLCFIGMLIHYSYIFTFMPPVLALVFYGIFFSDTSKKRKLCTASFVAGSGVTLGLFFYFGLFANEHLKMTSDELYEYMASKYTLTGVEEIHMKRLYDGYLFFRVYIDCYFFNKDRELNQLENLSSEYKLIRSEVINYVSPAVYIKYACIFLPLFIAFVVLWLKCMKNVKGAKKLPYIAFICMPVTLIPACIMSTDVWRWVSASVISQFAVLFALYMKRSPELIDVINSELFKKMSVKIILCVLCVCYIACALYFGVDLPIAN